MTSSNSSTTRLKFSLAMKNTRSAGQLGLLETSSLGQMTVMKTPWFS